MVLLLFWALVVLFTIRKPSASTSSIPSLSNSSDERLSIPVRVFCRSPVPGPIPSIVDCVPSITQMALGPGAFLPQTYRRGSERHWDGYSGQGYCKIAMSGGTSTVAYSDDELLEYVLWMVGRCFPPGTFVWQQRQSCKRVAIARRCYHAVIEATTWIVSCSNGSGTVQSCKQWW
ncbi:hypothetical protein XPA_004506 [Xanthoria parietina]